MLETLRRAQSDLGAEHLTRDAYDRWHAQNGQGYCASSYMVRFGSWNRARHLAGLPPRQRPARDAIIRYTGEIAQRLGHYPTVAEWLAQPDRPCGINAIQMATGCTLNQLRPLVSAILRTFLTMPEDGLGQRERMIVDLTKEGLTLRAIGSRLGLSGERVRQIARRAARRQLARSRRGPAARA